MNKKINDAVRILQLAEKQADIFGEPVEIAYSGGKDSDVLLELARMAGIKYRAIYKNTTIDPPGTIAHCRANGVEIRHPKKTFFQIVKSSGFPSFRFRFCCQRLKEYKILNTAAWGVRADESPARAKRYKTFNFCRKYSERECKYMRRYSTGRSTTLRSSSKRIISSLRRTIIEKMARSIIHEGSVVWAVLYSIIEVLTTLRKIYHYYVLH